MQMIIAVDLLPRVEYVYNVNKLMPYGHMDVGEMQVQIISQAIHGARTIRMLQGDVVFTGILGGFVGKYSKHYMDIKKIKSDILWAEIQTPHGIKIVDEEMDSDTVIQKDLKIVDERLVAKLEQKIKLSIKRTTTLLLEGRMLNGVCPQIYNRLIGEGKRYSVKTIVTTNQPTVLSAVLEQAPYGLMFTMNQLEALGMDPRHVEDIVQALRVYLDKGVHYIGVDLQNQGGLILSKNKFCYVEPIIDEVNLWSDRSSAAFLGAFAIGIDRMYEQEKIAKLAVASAFAFQISGENMPYNKSAIDKLLKKVKVRELSKTLPKVR